MLCNCNRYKWFKTINDIRGHSYADQVLINFSNQLHLIKRFDGNADIIRSGGDEFIISCINISNTVYRDLIYDIASFGTYFKKSYEKLEVAIIEADKLMYAEKKLYKQKCRRRETDIMKADQ